MITHRPFSRSVQQVFDLVADIESYPDFLPEWQSAEVLESTAERIRARQRLGIAGLDLGFDTEAELCPPEAIRITSRGGPFRQMDIAWGFRELDPLRCEVRLEITATLKNPMLEVLVLPALVNQQDRLLERFAAEAERRYPAGESD